MAVATKTLKPPFLRLKQAKVGEFARLQALNTALANELLAMPKKERKALTTASFRDVEIGSAWVNQTLRNANAKTMEVPDAGMREGWLGVDRGQKVPAVVALPNGGRLVFFQSKLINHKRREYAKRRKALHEGGTHRAVQKLEQRERRQVTHLNHKLSKEIVALAERAGCGRGLFCAWEPSKAPVVMAGVAPAHGVDDDPPKLGKRTQLERVG